MKRRLLSITLILAMCFTILIGCRGAQQTPGTQTSPSPGAGTGGAKTTFGLKPLPNKTTLRLGFFAGSPLSIPFYIADKEGFFKELNIDVKYETFTNGPAMMEANSSWDVAGAGVGGVLVGMLGYDIRTISISDYEKNLALFARKDSNLAKNPKDPNAWKGTTWLFPMGTTAQAVLVAALKQVNLGMNDIKSVNMDVASALTAYNGGQGDGLGVWNAVAFNAEDKGYVRLGDAGTLGFTAPCGTLATKDALANKRELVKTAYAVFHYTVEWMNANDQNKAKAIQHYFTNTNDEGITVSQSIAERVMKWYAGPTVAQSIKLMSDTADDVTGQYKTRKLLQAERDFMVGMDFFISQAKYTQADRNKILDNKLIDPSIAQEVKAMLDQQGLKY